MNKDFEIFLDVSEKKQMRGVDDIEEQLLILNDRIRDKESLLDTKAKAFKKENVVREDSYLPEITSRVHETDQSGLIEQISSIND